MKDIFLNRQDCKPSDYRFLSICLSSLDIFSGNSSIALNLEKIFMKSLICRPTTEQRISLSETAVFEGNITQTVRFFCMRFSREKKPLSNYLMKLCRISFN